MQQWVVTSKRADFKEIGRRFGIDQVTARIIRNRDVIGEDAIAQYLNGSLKDLYEPRLLPDMEKAISILKESSCKYSDAKNSEWKQDSDHWRL